MQLLRLTAGVAVATGALFLFPAAGWADDQTIDDRRDARGPTDVRSALFTHSGDRLTTFKIAIKTWGPLSARNLPCIEFTNKDGKRAKLWACSNGPGKPYQLMNVKTGKRVANVTLKRTSSKLTVEVPFDAFFRGFDALKWRIVVQGPHDSYADVTQWETHDLG